MNFKETLISEGINDKGIFKAIFLAGSPGAGKSYSYKKIKSGQIEPRLVNTDVWTEKWNNEYSPKADVLTKKQLVNYINSMLPLVIDGTSSSISNLLKRRGLLEGYGYDCGMVFVETSLDTALKRNQLRERKVDDDFLKNVHSTSIENRDYYKSIFKFFLNINNDEGELTDKVITKAFNKASSFFNGEIVNPLGKRNKQTLIDNGWKYLSPNLYDLNTIARDVSVWYQK